MAYLPKSKYSVKYSSGDTLTYKSDSKKYYVGDYILTSKGKYYAGTNNIYLGEELILRDKEHIEGEDTMMWASNDVLKHKVFKNGIDKFISKVIPIPHEKPTPTEKDYKKGVFTRYFTKRINGNHFMEISVKTFGDLEKKNKKYDYNLYETGTINWHLNGNVFKKNTITIKKAQQYFRSIHLHFHKLDEYKIEERQLQTHLNTGGNELYFDNGAEYIGEYHITSTGPMVGPIHTKEPHSKLYYSKKPPISTSSSGKIRGY